MQIQTNTAKVIPWSYSSLQAFETCPRRYYLTKVAKQVKEPQTEATIEGNAAHRALDKAVEGSMGLPIRFKRYQPLVDKVRLTPGVKRTEHKFGLTNSFKPTGYWDHDVWFRGVIDLAILRAKSAVILDYKTGKPKDDDDQLSLFAATTFAEYPQLEVVHTGYAWLAHDSLVTNLYNREHVPVIWQKFLPRIQRMERSAATGDFPARPSGLCREWCPVGKGLCEFCGKD